MFQGNKFNLTFIKLEIGELKFKTHYVKFELFFTVKKNPPVL